MALSLAKLRSVLALAMYLALVLSILAVSPAAAEDLATYPSATIRIIVPYPAGGTADALPRIIGDRLQARWKQSVIIINRPGAGGNIGAETVAVAEPNGYTLLASPPGPLVINEALYKELTFRPSEFEPAIVMGSVPNVMDVRLAFPAKSAHDVLKYILANPGKVTFASQGVGTTSHLAGILFEKLSGSSMVHVPYGGSAPALQDIMGDRVDLLFDNLASSLPLYRAQKLQIIAVGSLQRIAALPDVPTVAEIGVPGFESGTWFAIVAPPKTPHQLLDRLNKAVNEILSESTVKSKFADLGVQPVGGTLAETDTFVARERQRWGELIRAAGIQAN
ncbi:MAG TPA: tripartite tricarboxylate transporter substrate binding protein [Pseudolabrys sp.]|nr:tripartite tricarboxylate transporter substrate binding protein [Pseudolabrys sp.]